MRLLLLVLLLGVAGCRSAPNPIAEEPHLIGTFCHAGFETATYLTLKADHTYAEDFRSAAAGIDSGPRDHGRWATTAGKVFLFPVGGSRRVLALSGKNDALILSEVVGSKIIRTYRQ